MLGVSEEPIRCDT